MFLLHEVHQVIGQREDEFEAAFRDGWLASMTESPDARLLYFLHHAHGTGESYCVVTITALRDAAAWERLMERVHSGDLAKWAGEVDRMRRGVTAKLLVPLPWSPVQEIDLAAVPTAPATRDPVVFMEDTVWPYPGQFEEYVERSGTHYAREMDDREEAGESILRVEASYRTALGAGQREVVLWQRVMQPRALAPLISREVPARFRRPGTWMHDALSLRDRWESRLLRTATWSPLP